MIVVTLVAVAEEFIGKGLAAEPIASQLNAIIENISSIVLGVE
jgi:hypothetical protein